MKRGKSHQNGLSAARMLALAHLLKHYYGAGIQAHNHSLVPPCKQKNPAEAGFLTGHHRSMTQGSHSRSDQHQVAFTGGQC